MKKPTRLPALKQTQRRDALRTVIGWALLYATALAIIVLDTIVWRP